MGVLGTSQGCWRSPRGPEALLQVSDLDVARRLCWSRVRRSVNIMVPPNWRRSSLCYEFNSAIHIDLKEAGKSFTFSMKIYASILSTDILIHDILVLVGTSVIYHHQSEES